MIKSERSNKETSSSKQIVLKVEVSSELLKFLLEKLKGKSRNSIKSLLSHKQIWVNNRIVTQFNHQLFPGQEVIINKSIVKSESPNLGIKIVFEDPYIIVIDKNSGLLSSGTAKEKQKTAFGIVNYHVKKDNPKNKIYAIANLERETSGLMVFAKSEETQNVLRKTWNETLARHKYVALVEGAVENEEDIITSWLKESVALKVHSSPYDNGGQKAVTHYKLLKKNNYYSLLEISFHTLLKNQIRVHMQSIGHCVVGDKKYGSSQNPMGRVGLHAREIAFEHPVTKKLVHFETDIPKKFISILNK